MSTAPFVAQLRTRPGTIEIGGPAGSGLAIRVQVPEVWDAVRVQAPADTAVSTVKARAVEALLGDADPGQFVVKLRGAVVANEAMTLAESGALNGSTYLVTSRHRRPIR